MRLEIGNSIAVIICSKIFWNETTIEIKKGEEYKFEAVGFWKDLFLNVDTNGYSNLYMSLFDKLKRSKSNKWFALMGSINQKEDFLIGKSSQIVFTESGTLFCYANDIKGFYWNNSGQVSLKITRLI